MAVLKKILNFFIFSYIKCSAIMQPKNCPEVTLWTTKNQQYVRMLYISLVVSLRMEMKFWRRNIFFYLFLCKKINNNTFPLWPLWFDLNKPEYIPPENASIPKFLLFWPNGPWNEYFFENMNNFPLFNYLPTVRRCDP